MSTLVLSDVTLTGATSTMPPAQPRSRPSARWTLDGATITDNALSGKRETSAAVAIQGSGAVTITDSIIENTVNGAAIVDSGSGGSFTIVARPFEATTATASPRHLCLQQTAAITDAEIVDNHDPDT
ncbi:MAG: hypothetical protein R2690_08210 [Acidimicrobiales bacterium]